MTAIDDLNASITNLQAQASAENTELGAVVGNLESVSAQLSQLQASVGAGGTVTADQLEAMAASIKTVADSAAAAVQSAQSTTAPAPAGGGAPAPTQERSLYTFDGDGAVDPITWPDSGLVTTETPPRKLYFYSGDTAPGDKKGDGIGGVWHLYTGATQPAPAAPAA